MGYIQRFIRYLKSRLRFLFMLCLGVAVIKIPWIIYNFSYLPGQSLKLRKEDLLARRRFLIENIRRESFGLNNMTIILPDNFKEEWLIGTLSMTAAAVTNLAFEFPETREKALEDVSFMIKRMLMPDIKKFETRAWGKEALENLDSNDGQIGYLGHLNFMLGAHTILGGGSEFERLHSDISEALARRLEESKSGYLETFPGLIFVPDNMVVYASLALGKKLEEKRLSQIIQRWRRETAEKVTDPESGLLRSWVDPESGYGFGPPRGSYMGWDCFYLSFFAPDLSRSQFKKLKEIMTVDLPFGAKAIREYPRGTPGWGDIDSGPVILGMSTSGTGFSVSGARLTGDSELFRGLLLTAEIVGSTIETSGGRRYLLAPFVGEAIMLAMKTVRTWEAVH